jgi:hypothetical protein
MRRRPKHLPDALWPEEDRRLFAAAYVDGDIFDDTRGAGAHLAEGSRRSIHFGWRRWLGFLHRRYPRDLHLPAAQRVTPTRLRAYVEHLGADMSAGSVATAVAHLYLGARLVAPDRDWSWLKTLKTRLEARGERQDRFDHLVPPHRTLDLGLRLMDEALTMPASGCKARELQYRDGLILALLSLWPIRRRSLAALTVSRHVTLRDHSADVHLPPGDTKAKRQESWPAPELVLPYLRRYVSEIRPRLLRDAGCDALWLSQRGGALQGDAIYAMVKRRTEEAFGRAMALHDFRRAAPTFLAMDAPEKIGLTPGILQHAGPDVGDRIYNLARSTSASRRYGGTLAALKARLRSCR